MFNQIVSNGGNHTVLSLVEKYVSLKIGVRHNTRAGYKTVRNILKKYLFGDKRIDKVKLSDAKAWLIELQQVDGRDYSSVHTIRGVLRPAFQMPKITPHVCRHTFCSNMAKSGMNPKTLQYIMGHSDISVTLNTYTHVDFEDAQSELQRVAGE